LKHSCLISRKPPVVFELPPTYEIFLIAATNDARSVKLDK